MIDEADRDGDGEVNEARNAKFCTKIRTGVPGNVYPGLINPLVV